MMGQTMWDRCVRGLERYLVLASLVALVGYGIPEAARADDTVWRWVILAPGGSAIDQFSGTGSLTINGAKIEAVLNEHRGLAFAFRGEIDPESKVSVVVRWPNTDAGDVAMTGERRQYRNPNGTGYQVIWLVDRFTGIYLVMNRND